MDAMDVVKFACLSALAKVGSRGIGAPGLMKAVSVPGRDSERRGHQMSSDLRPVDNSVADVVERGRHGTGAGHWRTQEPRYRGEGRRKTRQTDADPV